MEDSIRAVLQALFRGILGVYTMVHMAGSVTAFDDLRFACLVAAST